MQAPPATKDSRGLNFVLTEEGLFFWDGVEWRILAHPDNAITVMRQWDAEAWTFWPHSRLFIRPSMDDFVNAAYKAATAHT